MGSLQRLQSLLLLCILANTVDASVYSCEEVRYRLINTSFTQNTRYACVVTQEGFSNWNQLEKVYAQVDKFYTSFHDIATGSTGCIENVRKEHPWDVFADAGLVLDCSQEFTLFLTSDLPAFVKPLKAEQRYRIDKSHVLVVPQTGMWMHKRRCVGSGNVTVSTGAGVGVEDDLLVMKTWTCSSLPDWLFSFDSVITINVDPEVEITMECSSLLELDALTMVLPGDRLAILSSGRSDDLQNLEGSDEGVFVLIGEWESHDVTIDMQLNFDPANTGSITLQKTWGGQEFKYYNGSHQEKFTTSFFEVHYAPAWKQPQEIWKSQDNIIIEIAIDSKAPSTAPTDAPANRDPYCDCSIDSNGAPIGWEYSGIWVDVVVVLDASEAMGQESLDKASALTESLISTGGVDNLITDTAAPLFTRVGVIAMGQEAKILYNLNMTKADKIQGKVAVEKDLKEINIVFAFEAASSMLSDGLTSNPERSNTRQVIYFMTDSDFKNDVNLINDFKSRGVIVVNNFLKDGELERDGLRELASDGYFFSDTNCYCKPDKTPYGGSDPAVKASGGCFNSSPHARLPFSQAKSRCSSNGGILATIHDDEKDHFVQRLMTSSKSDFFWIGYSKTDDGVWQWEDESTDQYTNWGDGEPSSAAVAKCAYVDMTTSALPWGAANCQIGFPYVCEYAPCSVGNKNC